MKTTPFIHLQLVPRVNPFLRSLICLFFLLLIVSQVQAQPRVTAYLEQSEFSLGRSVVLTVIVDGADTVKVILPDVENVTVWEGGQQKEEHIVNGETTSSVTTLFLLKATQPGDYVLRPIQIEANGATILAEAISFEVATAKSSEQASLLRAKNGKSLVDLSFIKVTKIKKSTHPGEIFPIEIRAYFPQRLKVQVDTLPHFQGDGFVMPPVEPFPPQSREIINGEPYSVMIWETTLSGVKEGAHEFTVGIDATLTIPQKPVLRGRYRDYGFFKDESFDDFFEKFSQKMITLSSETINATVQAFPGKGQPAGFTGAIGDFEFDVYVEKTVMNVGDPIQLIHTIKGRGNFDRVESPSFPANGQWRVYGSSAESDAGTYNLEGKKVFSQTVVPLRDFVTEVPTITFSYYDPEKHQYITKQSKPVPIRIVRQGLKGGEPKTPHIESGRKGTTDMVEERLAPLRPSLGQLTQSIAPVQQKLWILVACTLLATFMFATMVYHVYQKFYLNNSDLRRSRLLHKTLLNNIRKIEMATEQEDTLRFLASCRTTIQQQFGVLWQKDPMTVTPGDIRKKVPEARGLAEIFEVADVGVYSQVTLAVADMDRYCETLQRELGRLS